MIRALLVLILCVAAATGSAVEPSAAARTVLDDLGKTVSVKAPPLRLVSLAPGIAEMLFAAGAGEQLVATVEYSDTPPAARRVPRIGDATSIDMERLVMLHADVVLAWPDGGNPAQRAHIERLGVPVYDQEVRQLADLAASVRRLGVLAGTGPAADRAARAVESRLAALHQEYGAGAWGAGRSPSVLLEIWNRPIYTVGGRQLMSDALTLCGARNVFVDLREAGPVVDVEAVIARDPDIIIAAGPPGESAAWLSDWKRFASLSAVRHARLIAFEDQALSRLGPSVLDATAALCRAIAHLKP